MQSWLPRSAVVALARRGFGLAAEATAGSQPPFGVRGYWAAAASPQPDAGRVVWGQQVASSAMCYSDPLVAPQSGGSGFKGTVL